MASVFASSRAHFPSRSHQVHFPSWSSELSECTILCALRHIFYLHKAPIGLGQNLDKPESFGFLHNQVLPLRIPTSDGERLYAWLVTPLALYAQNEKALLEHEDSSEAAIKLLNDPRSRLVIYFHGNAGTVGQTRRTDAYRLISSGSSEQTHVLTFDYRGFGRSTGSPTELGLIDDALSVIRWATTAGKVCTENIVLVAQSLGTAVAIGAVETLLRDKPSTEFSGILLCAAFTDAASIFTSYRVGGRVPVLAPLRYLRPLHNWFRSNIRDKWDTRQRLRHIVSASQNLKLTFLAAECDEVIPFQHTKDLFYDTIREVVGTHMDSSQVDDQCEITDQGAGGTIQKWQLDQRLIKKVLVPYGGHNGIMKWAPVALEVFKSLDVK